MKKVHAYLFITVILVILSGCTNHDSNTEHKHKHRQAILPFSDGDFIISSSDFDEGRFVGFVYGEGWHEWSDTFRGIGGFRYYQATNFLSYAEDFINIINGLSPILLNSIIVEGFDNPSFEDIALADFLYSLQFHGVFIWICAYEMDGFDIRMSVHKNDEYGLLYFVLQGRKAIRYPAQIYTSRSDVSHHSLYRITLSELDEIISFAENLERAALEGHGHFVPMQYHIFIGVGIGVAIIIACCAILLIVRRRKKANFSSAST